MCVYVSVWCTYVSMMFMYVCVCGGKWVYTIPDVMPHPSPFLRLDVHCLLLYVLGYKVYQFCGEFFLSILCLAIRMLRLDIYFQAKILQEIWALKWSFLCLCKKKYLPIDPSTWLVKNQRNSVVQHNRTDWCMNSQTPCQHAQGLYRFKIKGSPVLRGVLDGIFHH